MAVALCILRARALGLFAAVAVLLFASPADAQGVATTVDPTVIQADIAANPNYDVAALWRGLKIPTALDTVWANVGGPPPSSAPVPFDRCANSCRAELSRANVDDDGNNEVIVVIYQEGKLCRFLLFKGITTTAGATQWRFLGYADHDALGQYEPEYRVATLGARHYFVTLLSGLHKDGMWVRYERWYEIAPASLREVLSVPADGFECVDARSLCRAFGAAVVAARTSPRGEEFVASYTVRYWGDAALLEDNRSEQIPLFSRTMRAVYVRPLKATGRYELNPLDSDAASWELDMIFRLEGMDCQDFMVANVDNLARLAEARDTPARSWLARYINGCSISEQRTELLKLLAK